MTRQPVSPASRTKSTALPQADASAMLAALDHPCKDEILALRRIILGADPSIVEGVKWNAPSYRTGEYFATFHLKAKDGVQVILHRGAKVRDIPHGGLAIPDPAGLLQWHGADRASVVFSNAADITARQAAFGELLRQWIRYV